MEYVYAALLLHKAGKEITESAVTKVLEAAGVKPDEGRVKALIAALDGVNIEETIKNAALPAAAPAPAGGGESAAPAEEKKEEKKEKKPEEKKPEEAAAGLGALFG